MPRNRRDSAGAPRTHRRTGRARIVDDRPQPAVDEAVAAHLADVMHALSTPSRVQILAYLREGPRSVGAITDALGMEQSAVSHQLRVLREHTLVRAERDGRQRVYRLYDGHVNDLLAAAFEHVADRRATAADRSSSIG